MQKKSKVFSSSLATSESANSEYFLSLEDFQPAVTEQPLDGRSTDEHQMVRESLPAELNQLSRDPVLMVDGFDDEEKPDSRVWAREEKLAVSTDDEESFTEVSSGEGRSLAIAAHDTPESSQNNSPISSGSGSPPTEWTAPPPSQRLQLEEKNLKELENKPGEFQKDSGWCSDDDIPVLDTVEDGDQFSEAGSGEQRSVLGQSTGQTGTSSRENYGSVCRESNDEIEAESSQNLFRNQPRGMEQVDSLAELSSYLKEIKVHNSDMAKSVLAENGLNEICEDDSNSELELLVPSRTFHLPPSSNHSSGELPLKNDVWESLGGSGPISKSVETLLWEEFSMNELIKGFWGEEWDRRLSRITEDVLPKVPPVHTPNYSKASETAAKKEVEKKVSNEEVLSFSEHIARAAEALRATQSWKELSEKALEQALREEEEEERVRGHPLPDGEDNSPKFHQEEQKERMASSFQEVSPGMDPHKAMMSPQSPPSSVIMNAKRGIGSSSVSPGNVKLADSGKIIEWEGDTWQHGREVDQDEMGSVFTLKLSSVESGSDNLIAPIKRESSELTVQSPVQGGSSRKLQEPKRSPFGSASEGEETPGTKWSRKALGLYLGGKRSEENNEEGKSSVSCVPIGRRMTGGVLSCFMGRYKYGEDGTLRESGRWRFLRPPRVKNLGSVPMLPPPDIFMRGFESDSTITHSSTSVQSIPISEPRSCESEAPSQVSEKSAEPSRSPHPEAILGPRILFEDDHKRTSSFDTLSSGQFEEMNLFGDEDAFTVPIVRWEALPSRVLSLGQSLQEKQLDWLQNFGTTTKLVGTAQRILCCLGNLSERPPSLGTSIPYFLELHRVLVRAAGYRGLRKSLSGSGRVDSGGSNSDKKSGTGSSDASKIDLRTSVQWKELEETAKKMELEIRVWLIKYVLSSLDEEKGNKKSSWKLIAPRARMGLEEKLMLLGSLKGVQDWTKWSRKWGQKVLGEHELESLSHTNAKIDAFVKKLK